MENLSNNSYVNIHWVTEVAQESAKYLLDVFEDEDANVAAVVSSLAQMCIERKEALAFLNIRGFFRETGHPLPKHFNETAADIPDKLLSSLLLLVMTLPTLLGI